MRNIHRGKKKNNFTLIENVYLREASTYHIFDDFVFAIVFLDFEQMVAEIQHSKAALLPKQRNDHAASPVEPIAKALPGDISSAKAFNLFHDIKVHYSLLIILENILFDKMNISIAFKAFFFLPFFLFLF